MYKCIDVGSWDFGVKTAEIIPVSSRGLTASDSNSFFTKRAGEHKFKEVLDTLKLAKDEIPVHLIAMGAGDSFSCNKNGDYFDRQTLKDRHHTFVKNAHLFLHHDNKDPKKAFGKVAASVFNDDMDRVELLVLMNGGKEAAEKNGGLIMPAEDIQTISEGKELPFSMGCKVGRDYCSNCNNGAKTAADYCEEHECLNPETKVQRFGCKSGLTKTAEDGFVQYVDNPNCTFIDISRVTTPADRTAYGAIAKYAASAESVLGGAQLALARGIVEEPEERIIKTALLQPYYAALSKLAAIESVLKNSEEVRLQARGFQSCDDLPKQVQKHAASLTEDKRNASLMHLADYGIVLSPKQFAKYAGYKVSSAYHKALNNIFGQLDRAYDYKAAVLDCCTKYACTKLYSVPPYFSTYKLANFYTKEGEFDRICAGVLENQLPQIKQADTIEPTAVDYKTAIEYTLYKIAVVTRLNDDIHYVTAVIQNKI